MPALSVLVIDDEPVARDVLAASVRGAGYAVDTASGVAQAMAKLARGEFDAALCDIQMPDGDGIDLLKRSRASGLDTAFVMVTAFGSVDTAVEALRAGAYDYIIKPVRHAEVLHRLSQIEALSGLREENKILRKAAIGFKPIYPFSSAGMLKVNRLVDKVARTDNTVLITGESGTGKGVIARAVHERSERCEGPFLQVNCGAIPEHLMESEFFGHTKGAFTGADRAEKGLFVEADQGTLFLDEIAEMPLLMQTKLLHVIEDKQVRAVGSAQTRKVDTRIIAATNRNLAERVGQGRFREDLYFRLSVFEIPIPPLRERQDDIRGLIQFMLRANGRKRNVDGAPAACIDAEAEEILLRHAWPGNVRELENVITRACILAEGACICVDDLPVEMNTAPAPERFAEAADAGDESLRDQRRKFEAEVVLRALKNAGGDRRLAAQRLKISLSSLYSKLGESEGEAAASGDAGGQGAALRRAES